MPARPMRALWLLGLVPLAGCVSPPRIRYDPASYASPPAYPPLPYPIQVAPPPVVTVAPLPPPVLELPPPALPAVPLIDPFAPLPPDTSARPPPPDDTPPPPVSPPAGDDPVADLLLGVPPAKATPAAEVPVVKAPSAPEANPMMGFRPMRGQTPPKI